MGGELSPPPRSVLIPSILPRASAVSQSLLSMILEQFEDRLVQILLAVAVLSGVLSAFEDDPHVSGENIMFLTH